MQRFKLSLSLIWKKRREQKKGSKFKRLTQAHWDARLKGTEGERVGDLFVLLFFDGAWRSSLTELYFGENMAQSRLHKL